MQLIIQPAENGFVIRRSTTDCSPDPLWIAATIAAALTIVGEQLAIPDGSDEQEQPAGTPPAPGGAKRGRKPRAEAVAAGPADGVGAAATPVGASTPAAGPGPAVPSTPPAASAAVPAAGVTDIKAVRDAHRAFCRASAAELATVGGPDKIKELNGGPIDAMDVAGVAAAHARIQAAVDALKKPAAAADY